MTRTSASLVMFIFVIFYLGMNANQSPWETLKQKVEEKGELEAERIIYEEGAAKAEEKLITALYAFIQRTQPILKRHVQEGADHYRILMTYAGQHMCEMGSELIKQYYETAGYRVTYLTEQPVRVLPKGGEDDEDLIDLSLAGLLPGYQRVMFQHVLEISWAPHSIL